MYVDQESIFYYLTVTNEPSAHAGDAASGKAFARDVLRGLYRFKTSDAPDAKLSAQLLGSGTIMFEVLEGADTFSRKSTAWPPTCGA